MAELSCQICSKPKANLVARQSKLLENHKIFICGECELAKREPRWLIILVGRSGGQDRVTPYIKDHRYCGKEISASELL